MSDPIVLYFGFLFSPLYLLLAVTCLGLSYLLLIVWTNSCNCMMATSVLPFTAFHSNSINSIIVTDLMFILIPLSVMYMG